MGRRGFFYDTWANKEDWLKIEINADQCPRFTKAFLREEQQTSRIGFSGRNISTYLPKSSLQSLRLEDIEAAFNHPELPVLDIDLELD